MFQPGVGLAEIIHDDPENRVTRELPWSYEPRMVLLTKVWPVGDSWMQFEDVYYLMGLHDGKPVVTPRMVSLKDNLGTSIKLVSRGDQGEA